MAGPDAKGEAATLLALLGGGQPEVFTFQTFDDSPEKRRHLTRVLHGPFVDRVGELADLNEAGASVNVMVNRGDTRGRATSNVQSVRSLFVDLDGTPLEPVLEGPLMPHAIVESSPGRFHAYWLAEGVPLESFSPLQRAVAACFDGDRAVVDLPRVMRLPGFLHQKGEPFRSRLVTFNTFPRYSLGVLSEAFGTVGAAQMKAPPLQVVDGSIYVGNRNQTLFALARGFVNKGFDFDQVLSRILAVNQRKCEVPLGECEVRALVESAVEHGPRGYLNLPLAVVDCPEYRHLSHAARTIAVAAYRRFNGENNGNISLPFSDFHAEFSRKETFYKARQELVRAGFLRTAKRRTYDRWAGRTPDLFEVALGPPGEPKKGRLADN